MDPKKDSPIRIGGKRACPPEDRGGSWAYQELLNLAASPFRDCERRRTQEILGRGFDPEAFDRVRSTSCCRSASSGKRRRRVSPVGRPLRGAY
ncbi:plasmid pRiA4b ORF-3 family protein [Rubrobacter tropicus]|uniref:plasmid pRiA4b ORF-3 family protein n=1 Tax=Rubrobacter tropicus TaxID=2653851 RepID=UPI001409D615